MPGVRNSHCSYCGAAFVTDAPWPRVCARCGSSTYQNPIPVAVLIVPVEDGVLLVRRGIEPHRGELALPGGYIDVNETWQEAAAREVWEETSIHVEPGSIREFRVRSAPDGTVLIFGVATPWSLGELPTFVPTEETAERTVVVEPVQLAFALHTEVLRAYFAQRTPVANG